MGLLELLPGVSGFVEAVFDNTPLPELQWHIEPGSGTITFTASPPPDSAVLRYSETYDKTRRDFRLVRGDTPWDPCKRKASRFQYSAKPALYRMCGEVTGLSHRSIPL